MQILLLALVMLACFSPLGFALWRNTHRPQSKCPACGQPGYVAGFGRFRCARCSHCFVLRYRGGTAPSLTTALLPPLCLSAVVFAVIIVNVINRHDYYEFWLLGLLVVQLALWVLMAKQTKRFPNVDEN